MHIGLLKTSSFSTQLAHMVASNTLGFLTILPLYHVLNQRECNTVKYVLLRRLLVKNLLESMLRLWQKKKKCSIQNFITQS